MHAVVMYRVATALCLTFTAALFAAPPVEGENKPAPKPCLQGSAVPLNGARVEATAGSSSSSIVQIPTSGAATPTSMCWLTPAQAASGTDCSAVLQRDRSTEPFKLESCIDGNRAAVYPGTSVSGMKNWQQLILTYSPEGEQPRRDAAFVQIKWSDSTASRYYVEGIAGSGFDPLYRLTTFLGTTSAYSQNDFGKNFPELRLLVESRLHDGYEECLSEKSAEECRKGGSGILRRPNYFNLRLYGDVGLTSTNTSTSSATEPSFATKRAFDGSFCIGYGGSYNRATRPSTHYTNRMSISAVARLGEVTTPSADANQSGQHYYHDMFGIRIENENGPYEGAFFETGIGSSEQYVYEQHRRWKSQAYLPFFQPGTVRLATRLQVDIPAPWSRLNQESSVRDDAGKPLPAKTARELLRAGEFRITFLVSIDIKKLFTLAGASVPQ